jgi:hypothetical protein
MSSEKTLKAAEKSWVILRDCQTHRSENTGCNISSMTSRLLKCVLSNRQVGLAIAQFRVRSEPEEEEEEEEEEDDKEDGDQDDDQDGYSE